MDLILDTSIIIEIFGGMKRFVNILKIMEIGYSE